MLEETSEGFLCFFAARCTLKVRTWRCWPRPKDLVVPLTSLTPLTVRSPKDFQGHSVCLIGSKPGITIQHYPTWVGTCRNPTLDMTSSGCPEERSFRRPGSPISAAAAAGVDTHQGPRSQNSWNHFVI